MTRTLLTFFAFFVAVACHPAQGTNFSLVTTLGGAFDQDFNPISTEQAMSSLDPVIWQVDFGVLTENLSADHAGFGVVAFSVNFEDSTDAFDMGWQSYNPNVASTNGLPGSVNPLFMTNMDAGASASDERGILAHIAPNIADPTDARRSIGQAPGGPSRVGSLFVKDVPSALSRISVDQVEFSGINLDGSFFRAGDAYGQATMTLPRASGGMSPINVSTANVPPPPVHVPNPSPTTPAPPTPDPVPPVITPPPQTQPSPQPAAVSGDFSLVTSIGGAFDRNLNPISHEAAMASSEPVIWKVDFSVATDRSADESGFGSVAFSVKFNNSSDALDLNWQPHNPAVTTTTGPQASRPLFMNNMDAGPSASDEHGILAYIAPGLTDPTDPRKLIGQTTGSPDLIGSIFVEDDPFATSSITIENVEFGANGADGKFFGAGNAYGEMTMQLPRSPEGPSVINVSTANAPPVLPETVTPPTVPTLPPVAEVPPGTIPVPETTAEPVETTTTPNLPPIVEVPDDTEQPVTFPGPDTTPPVVITLPEPVVPPVSELPPFVELPSVIDPSVPEGGVDPAPVDPDDVFSSPDIDITQIVPFPILGWDPSQMPSMEHGWIDDGLGGIRIMPYWHSISLIDVVQLWDSDAAPLELGTLALLSRTISVSGATYGAAFDNGSAFNELSRISVPEPSNVLLVSIAAIGASFRRH